MKVLSVSDIEVKDVLDELEYLILNNGLDEVEAGRVERFHQFLNRIAKEHTNG